jgi:hypothetical protein
MIKTKIKIFIPIILLILILTSFSFNYFSNALNEEYIENLINNFYNRSLNINEVNFECNISKNIFSNNDFGKIVNSNQKNSIISNAYTVKAMISPNKLVEYEIAIRELTPSIIYYKEEEGLIRQKSLLNFYIYQLKVDQVEKLSFKQFMKLKSCSEINYINYSKNQDLPIKIENDLEFFLKIYQKADTDIEEKELLEFLSKLESKGSPMGKVYHNYYLQLKSLAELIKKDIIKSELN